MDDRMGDNINGPSLIKVPDWIASPFGKYYLYFGHHDGKYIRLAYADEISGPWKMHAAGTLDLADSHFNGHIASPDVHVDHDERRIRMYYHGSDTSTGQGGEQYTRVALSTDGVDFKAESELLGNPYWRVFEWSGFHYAIGMPGVFYRSRNGISDFEEGPTLFNSNMRHSAVRVEGSLLSVYFTVVGDSPERIRLSTIDLSEDWSKWKVSEPLDILSPEFDWEGADSTREPSKRGLIDGPVNQLRDPALFIDGSRTYLLYSVAGESGIAIAELTNE
ncbi:MAG: hypothetical protein HOJ22_03230 [Chloroflexi bacterium]|mgnify:FL=1|jgi:hypothetical protein|nr:hypothetical protein [Chloroflexota bacterium]MBT5627280.1 hypothetical protein [Chloroflexota bacterium]